MPYFHNLPTEIQDDVFSYVKDSRKAYPFLFNRYTHQSAKVALYTYVTLVLWKDLDWDEFSYSATDKLTSELWVDGYPRHLTEGVAKLQKLHEASKVPYHAALLARAESLDLRLSEDVEQFKAFNVQTIWRILRLIYHIQPLPPMSGMRTTYQVHEDYWNHTFAWLCRLLPNVHSLSVDVLGTKLQFKHPLARLKTLKIRDVLFKNYRLADYKIELDLEGMGNLRTLSLTGNFGLELGWVAGDCALHNITKLALHDLPGVLARYQNTLKNRVSHFTALREVHLAFKDGHLCEPRDAINTIAKAFYPSRETLEVISLAGDGVQLAGAKKKKQLSTFAQFKALKKLVLPAKCALLDMAYYRWRIYAPEVEHIEFVVTGLCLASALAESFSFFVKEDKERNLLPKIQGYSFRADKRFLRNLREKDLGLYERTMEEVRKLVDNGMPCSKCGRRNKAHSGFQPDLIGLEGFLEEDDRRKQRLGEKWVVGDASLEEVNNSIALPEQEKEQEVWYDALDSLLETVEE